MIYVMFIHIYYIPVNIHIYSSIFIINYENIAQLFIGGPKLQRKELFKLWIERKGNHCNIKSEYVQNSAMGMHRYFCL
jgi:hypothetical protein